MVPLHAPLRLLLVFIFTTGFLFTSCGSDKGIDKLAEEVAAGGSGPGIAVAPTSGLVTSEDLTQDTFFVVLTSEPTADVTLPLSSSDITEGTVSPGSLVFTSTNWSTPQMVTVTGVDDGSLDKKVAYTINLGPTTSGDVDYDNLVPLTVAVENLENDWTVIPAFDQGWHSTDPTNAHQAGNTNTLTGNLSGAVFNSYYQFDLAGLSGAVSAAELRIFFEIKNTGDVFENLSLWDVTTDSVTLDLDGLNLTTTNDLMTGVSYGGFSVTAASAGTILTIPLNPAAQGDIISALGSTFAVGVHLDTAVLPTEWVRFDGPVHELAVILQ